MAKRKLAPIIKRNTLESMIEYTLITSILERICEMTKKLLEYLRDNTMLDPYEAYWHKRAVVSIFKNCIRNIGVW